MEERLLLDWVYRQGNGLSIGQGVELAVPVLADAADTSLARPDLAFMRAEFTLDRCVRGMPELGLLQILIPLRCSYPELFKFSTVASGRLIATPRPSETVPILVAMPDLTMRSSVVEGAVKRSS